MGFAFLCESASEVDVLYQKVMDAGYVHHDKRQIPDEIDATDCQVTIYPYKLLNGR